jgi:glycerate 2-kinase
VARRARAHHVPTVVAVCGRNTLTVEQSRAAGFDRVFSLTDLEPDVERSMRDAAVLLERVGAEVGRELRATSTR